MWHRQGKVNLTKGSDVVTGVGTNWVENVRVGDAFQGPDGKLYQVINVASNETLAISPAYEGSTAANLNYWIVPIPGYSKKQADKLSLIISKLDGDILSAYLEMAAILSGTHRAFANKALMDADLSASPGQVSMVLNDPDLGKNGWYFKVGISGSGSWSRLNNQPALDRQLNFVTEAVNWNNLTTSGKYRSPANSKSIGQPPVDEINMVVDHEEGMAGRAWQTAKSLTNAKPKTWIRSRHLSEWSHWRELITYKDGDPNNVYASQLGQRDFSNIYPDPELSDVRMLEGDFSLTNPAFGATQKNRISENVILIPSTADSFEFLLPAFPIEAGRPYFISATAGRSTGVGHVATSLSLKWFSDWDATQEITEVGIGHTITSGSPETRSEIVLAPQLAVRAKLVVRKQESQNPIAVAIYDIIVRRAITRELIYSPAYSEPKSGATSVVCYYPDGDVDSRILYEKSANTQIAPASLTKILTAYVGLKIAHTFDVGLSQLLSLTSEDDVGGSGNNLDIGDSITFYDALVNMFLPSSNNTAMMVARFFGTFLDGEIDPVSRFVQKMNSVAFELGMSESVFKNPTGLPESGQTTTAVDMAILMSAASKNKTILDVWGKDAYTIKIEGPRKRDVVVMHTVPLAGSSEVLGAKSGTIAPRDYHVALYVKAPGNNRIVIVILQSKSSSDRYLDAQNIINAFLDGYDWPILKPTPRT